ncbi:MAG: ADP-ribosylglycohydrolase family protein, partial [Chthonomonadaceae bacterium]|nr:ADP-ribosylglycohydrolase family protein [Chthonomonadaceae bacterium]
NFTDAPQNMGFLTIGLLYGGGDFGASLCAAVNCGYDAELVGGALGAILGILRGRSRIPEEWARPVGDVIIPGYGLRDMDPPVTLIEVAERTVVAGMRVIARRCADVEVIGPEGGRDATRTPSMTGETEPVEDSLTDESFLLPPPPLPLGDDVTESEGLPGGVPDPHAVPPSATTPARSSEPGMEETIPPVQPVSEQPAAPIHTGATSSPGVMPRLTPDYTTAIAWADNTLVKPLLVTPPTAMMAQAGPFRVVMDTGEAPSIGFGHPRSLVFTVVNQGAEPFSGRITLLVPAGWQVDAPPQFGQRQYIAASTGILRAEYRLLVSEGQGRIEIANAVVLRLTPEGEETSYDAEFVLMGASCWWCVGPFANFDGEGFDRSYLPEDRPGLHETYTNRMHQTVRWEKWVFPESTLDLEPLFKGSAGVCYGQTILHSPVAREARLVASTNSGVKMWLNGALVLRRFQREVFRPQVGSGNWAVDVHLQAGPNVVMVKWVRGNEPYQFNLSVSDRSGRGLPEVGNTSW